MACTLLRWAAIITTATLFAAIRPMCVCLLAAS